MPVGLLSNLICRGFIIDCSGLKTNGKHINESGSELRDYGLARAISTPGDTHRLTHEKSEAAGASQSTPPFGLNPLVARKIAGLRVRAGVGWGRRPFLLMVSRLESLDVMYPYMRGSVLSRSVSCIRICGALGALSSEVPATAGVSTLDPPGSDFELCQI